MIGKRKLNHGFTIVELLIVIVIIGILAAITITAYNGVQQRARDTQRKADLAQIAKSMQLYYVDYNDYVRSSCPAGWSGLGEGWYHNDYDGAGPYKSISQCLIDAKALNKALNDPQWPKGCTDLGGGQNECFYYMKYDCGTTTYLYANLESMPHSSTDVDATCQGGLDSGYGMNYYIPVGG